MIEILITILMKLRPLLYAFIVFIMFFIFYVAIGEDPRDAVNPALMVDNTVYWFEIGRYAEDLKDIQYYGVVDVMMEGDTSGLTFQEWAVKNYLEMKVDRYLNEYRSYNTGEADPKGFYASGELQKIGRIVIEIKLTRWRGFPTFYKIKIVCGTEKKATVYTALLLSSVKSYKLRTTVEEKIDFLVRKYAERFRRIKADYT